MGIEHLHASGFELAPAIESAYRATRGSAATFEDEGPSELLSRVRGDRVEISAAAQSLFRDDSGHDHAPNDESRNQDSRGAGPNSATPDSQLSDDDRRAVEELKRIDAEVRAHEQAHLSALGGEGGAASYEYTTGPDGKRYATSGEVPVSIGEASSGDPRETIAKAQRVARAAVAPAQPSAADLSARAKAIQVEREARARLREEQQEGSGSEAVASVDGSAKDSSGRLAELKQALGDAESKADQAGSCAVCGQNHGAEVSHAETEIPTLDLSSFIPS